MAGAGAGLSFSAVAAQDIDQFLAVALTPAGVVLSTSSAGEAVCGVSQDRALAGQALNVAFCGISKWQADGLFQVGSLLAADSSGRAVEMITSTAMPLGITVGLALTPSVALDSVVYALLIPRPQPAFLSGTLDPRADWWQAA